MNSLEHLESILIELKSNPKKYHLTKIDLEKIDKAIEEIDSLLSQVGILKKSKIALEIIGLFKLVTELFNSPP